MSDFMLFSAPLQGSTEAPWRRWHSDLFGGADAYFTPFMRIEKGAVRPRDLRDITSSLNSGLTLIPQILCRDAEEMKTLVDSIEEAGYSHVNINMGCPHPPQTHRGRGAGLLSRPRMVEQLAHVISDTPDIRFSVKMRLGDTDPNQWRDILPILASLPLDHITLHPRIATQQYRGTPDMDAVSEFLACCPLPVIYNGDILTPQHITDIRLRFPSLAGVMVGRGLLGRPSLFSEYRSATETSSADRLRDMVRMHDRILDHYSSTLCGDAQILSKIRPFWDYAEDLIGHRGAKTIRKASSLRSYIAAVRAL